MNFLLFFFWTLRNGLIPSHSNEFRPHLLRRASLVAVLVLVLGTEGFFLTGLVVSPEPAAVVQSDLISLTNAERVGQGDSILTENALLDEAALAKAQDMAHKGYFSHNGPDGKVPWEWIIGAGYRYQLAGENLAVRFTESEDVIKGWMNSPTHRSNMLKAGYTDIGIGVAEGKYAGEHAVYVVQYFASPAVALAKAGEPVVPPTSVQSVPPVPTVAAAETGVPHSATNQTLDKFLRTLSDPTTTNWILGGTGIALIVALFLTFFVHIQVQHGRALMGGAAVAFFALILLAANTQYLMNASTQSANVVDSVNPGVIDEGIALEQ